MFVVRIFYRPDFSKELPYRAHLMRIDENGRDLWPVPLMSDHATLAEAAKSPEIMGYRIEIMK